MHQCLCIDYKHRVCLCIELVLYRVTHFVIAFPLDLRLYFYPEHFSEPAENHSVYGAHIIALLSYTEVSLPNTNTCLNDPFSSALKPKVHVLKVCLKCACKYSFNTVKMC